MFPNAGGPLSQLIRDHDWASTPIGPLEHWPQSLKTITQMLLLSAVPIVLLWGEDGVMIYNDAYSAFAGRRHPRLLGSKVREGWDEIADFNDHVMRTGLAGKTLAFRDQELALERHGRLEPVWMDLDYSPVFDEAGKAAGVIAIVVETTEKVLAQRRVLESERRFRALTMASSDIIYRVSPDWTEIRQVDGRSIIADADAPGVGWMGDYLHPEDRAAVQAAIDEAISGLQPFQLEHRVRRADGTIGWVSSRAVPVTDENGVLVEWFGAASDVTERVRTTEHLRLVVNELNHRVKNTLAMVQAIAMRTFRDTASPGLAQEEFASRLVALAQANDLLTGERWAGASLFSTIEQAVRPHQHGAGRLSIRGDDLRISPKTALALAMAMHELATNALKHGAWSNDLGAVAIEWSTDQGLLHIEWRECGGPAVTPPARRGFGSRLIETGLASEFGGRVALQFDPGGVRCLIDAPVAVVVGE
ncbi:MAG: PAS domain-containing protein [Proteobacteria bacterium]|nr:PAS domain-containing protein [Pseudomonadota bacterium]